jgi:salicylate hydroxylase
MTTVFKTLDVAVIGGDSVASAQPSRSAAISLRRAGHRITIYERHDFAGEVGAGIGIPSNGSKWLYKWQIDGKCLRAQISSSRYVPSCLEFLPD